MKHRTVIKASLALLLMGGATWRLCAIEDYRPSVTDTLTSPTPLPASITIDDAVRIAGRRYGGAKGAIHLQECGSSVVPEY